MSGISRLWRPSQGQGQASAPDSPSGPGKTFLVPLFLSTSQPSARNNMFTDGDGPASPRSRTSTRSVIESSPSIYSGVRPLSLPLDARTENSDMYGNGVRGSHNTNRHREHLDTAPNQSQTDSAPISERSTTRSGSERSGSRSNHSSSRGARRHVKLSRKTFRHPRVNAKARISFAFGVTLLFALVIYLVLAITGVARNTMFHVLSILLILTLTGVFCHQLIRMFMLMRRRPRRPRHGRSNKARHGHTRNQTCARSRGWTRASTSTSEQSGPLEELPPEKPIQIFMATDDNLGPDVEALAWQPTIRPPPPVYGNFRASMRLNPDFVHLKHVPPSPLTPTYDEAVIQVQRAMGYRPPSYISESGVTEFIETRTKDVDAALENIHPLERERMRTFAAEALEGNTISRL
ncbi:hypothetical protein A1O1_05866 [Capronia coronata CBS 617.96]|uniref:Uncharacterized protein n=1 Tax=Capronia coronata CBS 617.96 TaxID=1182541 RepID=W9XY94_9EURO|nr:uncharacterized protein A1O1_05866 [Capronia coronata CBS 617.96]EXJ85502.1 hypothetical protein A1O1_05866 [Capronia coronata CBS 617.96]